MDGAQPFGRQPIDPGAKPRWVGRGPGADVPLYHPTVRRRHAVLFRTAAGLQVRDGSGGATRVNGRRVGEALLRDGDRVEFGAVPFRAEGGRLHWLQAGGGLPLAVEELVVEGAKDRILDGISLTLGPGEFVGLLGPSGAGKTTLLRCLIGYITPTTGHIRAEGLTLPEDAPSYWPQVGYVPQEDVLFPTLTARENLDYALRLRAPALARAERRELIEARLRQLGLGSRADKRVEKLSGGERKRVAVAVELLTEPRALFLDEPTAGLDPANETRVMRELRQLAETGTTVICATHVLENVQLCHRAVVLVGGRVAYDGPPKDLLEHFGVKTYPELYEPERLATRGVPPAPGKGADAGRAPVSRRLPPPALRLPRLVAVQVARSAHLLLRDHIWAAMLVLQPVLIGLLINLSQASFTRTSTVFTFAAVSAVWLGLNNTARELVRERRHYVRERLLGVSPAGYLLAKVLLYAAIGLGQLVLLALVLRYANRLDPPRRADLTSWPLAHVVGALWAAYLGAALLGLTVSALVTRQEWAVAALPLIVLPQLLLTGEAADIHKEGRFQSVAYLVNRSGQDPRTADEWAVEAASLLTFTRPCVALLKDPLRPEDPEPGAGPAPQPPSPAVARAADVGCLAAWVVVCGAALGLIFRLRERAWLRSLS
jgi:ABC-type multidrug transport system ATPase subunit